MIPASVLVVHLFCLDVRGVNGVVGTPESEGLDCRKLPCFIGCLTMRDNGGRRAALLDPETETSAGRRERRSRSDRRALLDRRDVLERRIDGERRNLRDMRAFEEIRYILERRSGMDRRTGPDRRSTFVCLFS